MKSKPKTFTVLPLVALGAFSVLAALALPALMYSVALPYRSPIAGTFGGALAVLLLLALESMPRTQTPAQIGLPADDLIARSCYSLTVAVMICDPQGLIVWVNEAFTEMTGYTVLEVRGQKPGYLLRGTDTDPVTVSEINRHIDNKTPFIGEILNYQKDGKPLWVRLDIKQVRSAGGEVEALIATQTDITDRKIYEIERERQLSEALAAADMDPLTGLLNHRAFHNHLRSQHVLAKQTGQRLAVLLVDLDNFKFFNEAYGHKVGDQVLHQVADTLSSASMGFGFDYIARFGGDEFAMLAPLSGTVNSEAIQPRDISALFDHLGYRPSGYDRPIPISVSVGIAVFPDDGTLINDVLAAASQRLVRAKFGAPETIVSDDVRLSMNNNREGFSMLDALVTAVDNKDRYTRRHSENVMEYAIKIADALNLEESTKTLLSIAALLHDVGKIGVPDRILRKPGALSLDELEAVKQHPQMGAVIVGAVPGFERAVDAIMYHHERWDGKGYPAGIAGEDIPLLARIMAVADGFSAMTTDRPYRKGMSIDDAYDILTAGAGKQWDPKIVDCFVTRSHVAAR